MSPCNNQHEEKETEQPAASSAMILSFPLSAYLFWQLVFKPDRCSAYMYHKIPVNIKNYRFVRFMNWVGPSNQNNCLAFEYYRFIFDNEKPPGEMDF